MVLSSPAEIFGVDAVIVVALVVVLLGSTQIPGLARSLGSARNEFRKGAAETVEDGTVIRVAPPAGHLLTAPVVHGETTHPPPAHVSRQSAGET